MSKPEKAAAVLRQIPIFSQLDHDQIQALADVVYIGRYRKNQVLFSEGEPARTLYFICQGQVKIYRTSPDGREQILHFLLRDGDPMAVVPFLDGGPYPATAEVVETSEIASLHFDDFSRIASQHPSILFAILRVLAGRLRQAQEEITSLSLKNVTARLSGRLLELADRHGEPVPDGVMINLPLNRQELGSLVGTSRETVTRLLHQFQREGVLRIEGSTITILKPELLRAWYEQ